MENILLELPYPPSANTYWRHPTKGKLAGRHLLSEKGREYRVAVQAAVMEQRGWKAPVTGRLGVYIEAHMPDKRKRDLDNLLKALFDSITHAGVWEDDSQLDDIRIVRKPPPTGKIELYIFPVVV